MIKYIWDCSMMEVLPTLETYTNVVCKVHYKVTCIDDEDLSESPKSVDKLGMQILNTDNITDFVNFEELINDDVTAWVKAGLGETRVSDIELKLKARYDSMTGSYITSINKD